MHAHDLLDDVPVVRSRLVKPLVNKLVGHPGYFRFESDFDLTVIVDGEKFERTGTHPARAGRAALGLRFPRAPGETAADGQCFGRPPQFHPSGSPALSPPLPQARSVAIGGQGIPLSMPVRIA